MADALRRVFPFIERDEKDQKLGGELAAVLVGRDERLADGLDDGWTFERVSCAELASDVPRGRLTLCVKDDLKPLRISISSSVSKPLRLRRLLMPVRYLARAMLPACSNHFFCHLALARTASRLTRRAPSAG